MKKFLEYDDIKEKIERLDIKDVDVILCITRGGLVPAGLLSYHLHVKKIINIKVESYDDQSQGELIIDKLFIDEIDVLQNANHILIVDDIYDTGATMKAVKKLLTFTHNVKLDSVSTFCVVEKKQQAVDYSLYTIEDDSWIVFPWDF